MKKVVKLGDDEEDVPKPVATPKQEEPSSKTALADSDDEAPIRSTGNPRAKRGAKKITKLEDEEVTKMIDNLDQANEEQILETFEKFKVRKPIDT